MQHVGVTDGSYNQPIVLSLDAALPMPLVDKPFEELGAAFDALRQPWPEESVLWDLSLLEHLPDLDASMADVLRTVPVWNGEEVLSVHIFVDGSALDTIGEDVVTAPAAWSFACLLKCRVFDMSFAFRFYCLTMHRLSHGNEDAHLASSVGELSNDPMSAEAVGMIWVLSWIAQSPFAVPHEVLFDNRCIGYFAAGLSEWVCSWVHERLHKAITSLRQFLQQAGAVLMFTHVHAHQHNPWNSLVDAVARALARGTVFERPLPSNYPRPQALRAMFACEGPGDMVCPDPTWIFAQDTAQAQTKMVFELSFASANVLFLSAGSASQQETGLMEIGRIATLQRQFDIAKTNIIGIQEARTQSPCTRHCSSHLVYQSGADATGVRGCELWLSRSIPYGVKRGKPLFFHPHHVHIASADTRHLLAQIHAPGLQIRLLVVHAPYQKG